MKILVAMGRPSSGLAWLALRRDQPGNSSQRLRQLGLGQIPLTHDPFHELQPWRLAAHLEELLNRTGAVAPIAGESTFRGDPGIFANPVKALHGGKFTHRRTILYLSISDANVL